MDNAQGFDLAPALAWAAGVIGPLDGVGELTGGWTSTMLDLRTPDGDGAVLRLMTREPWRSHGEALTTREHEVQRMLRQTEVPAPSPLALDAEGRHCGVPAHLMSRVPGRVDLDRVDDGFLGHLAHVLATIHTVVPSIDVRPYESWAWEAKYVVPAWVTDPALWHDAFALLRTDPPPHETCFIHRDFQPRNVLWHRGEVSGVVDWVETSLGPPWLDVAHCCTNLALLHGVEVADRFATAYAARTDREPQHYFDVMDIVGFLPPPGKQGFIKDSQGRRALEGRLRAVMDRISAHR